MLNYLGVRPAVLDERGEFEQREHVETVDRSLAARLAVDDEKALGIVRQTEEGLLAAERPAPEVVAGEPAERGADTGGHDTEHDVAQVFIHGRAW
ncbi:hypothetical protein J4032_13150 [Streptomyces formicae]|uniref:Uncharacterized protein n=1 Tax=Streptomyces formicae TaxID=1616117 RepID=A0ABY3WIE1_9ACTN|nr:hypothetical protein J4032_13150 [Streptomyces formicae]